MNALVRSVGTAVFTAAVCAALTAIGTGAVAAPSPSPTSPSQQDKMKQCNDKAKGMSGEDRKKFMKVCLSNHNNDSQQQKMKSCNSEATGMSGDDRKQFMQMCLSH